MNMNRIVLSRPVLEEEMTFVPFDPLTAPTHTVKLRGGKGTWRSTRQALYATGRVSMIEATHADGVWDVRITLKGRLNRASIRRIANECGMEFLPRDTGAQAENSTLG